MYCTHGTKDNHELINLKGIMSAYDNVLFLWHDATGNLRSILAIHIDDFVLCGNDFSEKCDHRIEKKYSKLEGMKVEHLNFGD